MQDNDQKLAFQKLIRSEIKKLLTDYFKNERPETLVELHQYVAYIPRLLKD
jgi:hypothetical protein